MDNLRLQDLAKEFDIQHLSTADQLLVLSHLPGEWPHRLIFRQRLNALLALHKNSPYETSAPIISQLITALDIKDDPESRSNKLSLFAAMKKLLDLALSFDTSNEDATIRLFLRHINKLRSEAQVPGRSHGNVQILTCHHSKGLEFPVVFVIGVQLGIFPNDFFIETAEDLEAERRLFYVAITRAKKALFLTAYHDPEWQPSKPDFELRSFLDSIPSSLAQEMY
jgi:DNA helicase-2/ATP-dependent DNA helicase PcrA